MIGVFMRKDRLPSKEHLNQMFELNGGTVYWKHISDEVGLSVGYSESGLRTINNQRSGHPVGCKHHSDKANGYYTLRTIVLGKSVYVHQIAFKMHYGYEPEQIDHIDGNTTNNDPSNLRDVDSSVNTKNKSLPVNNTSGVQGVMWENSTSKWRVRIGTGNGRKHIGRFECFDEAVAARKKAEVVYGYSENHGRDKFYEVNT